MNNLHKFFILLFLAVPGFFGCERDLETEGISKVTTFPTIALKGDQFITIPVNGTVPADPGATSDVTITTTGSVNPAVPGLYTISYTATNPEGFDISAYRYIAVIGPDAAAADLTGKYQRNAGAGGISTVTKLGLGHYTADNVGGVAVPGPETTVHFFHTDGTRLFVPEQTVEGGQVFSAKNASYNFGNPNATPDPIPASYTWSVINPGYGNAARTFVKQ